MEGGRGGADEISNGKVDGDNITFEVTREFNGNSFTTKYTRQSLRRLHRADHSRTQRRAANGHREESASFVAAR